ncbi:hypothetical protein L6164_017232 [Bauhinia variegata]|uniref:Uncharacterized protein n=1 Tax=Bauhinia variegata TaxID=167791 RepID=A0ACB9N813_BAUVA|nr:hypothetical protein L6164_017232 [Bauhinia variegata]
MASETKPWLMLLLFAATCLQHSVHGWPQVPCLFIFGDSSSDSGNNNYLPGPYKADFPPYGVDFPKGATGRFNNGKTTIDRIGELSGIRDFIPPFADYIKPFPNPHASDVYFGVNYATVGGGIDDQTGANLLKIYGLTDHINQHKSYTPQQWAKLLLKKYHKHLKDLHDYRARKFALSGLGLLGCRPNLLDSQGECNKEINDAVQLFNVGLRSLVDELNEEYSDSKFIYVNYAAIQSSVFPDFKTDAACCETEKEFGGCIREGIYCKNRDKYAFWDEAHTSEAVNKIAAEKSYNDPDGSFTYPTDIKTLTACERSTHGPEWLFSSSEDNEGTKMHEVHDESAVILPLEANGTRPEVSEQIPDVEEQIRNTEEVGIVEDVNLTQGNNTAELLGHGQRIKTPSSRLTDYVTHTACVNPYAGLSLQSKSSVGARVRAKRMW